MALALRNAEVPVKGIIPVSMLDWDGMLAAVVFLGGCNLKCPYCHNADLVSSSNASEVSWEAIEKHLISKKDWLDGVVITGGEPTIHKGLKSFISRIKALDMAVKLDTNGALPGALTGILEEKLVDYVAMDIKTSFEKYELATGTEIDTEAVKKSADLIQTAGVDYEFRTTVVPGITTESDILKIAEFLAGTSAYYLQQFKSSQVLEPQALISSGDAATGKKPVTLSDGESSEESRGMVKLEDIIPYTSEYLFELAGKCSKFVKTRVRNV